MSTSPSGPRSRSSASRRRAGGGRRSTGRPTCRPGPPSPARALLDPVPLDEIIPYIDWSPFFHTWELKGTYPRIFENPDWGARARELFDDAQRLLRRVADGRLLTARAVYGFFPANAVGDDIEVYADESRHGLLTTFHTLRQQVDKGESEPDQALADFIAPQASGLLDYLGAFAVTSGIGIEPLVERFERDHDDYGSIMTKALADRLAEGAGGAGCTSGLVRTGATARASR